MQSSMHRQGIWPIKLYVSCTCERCKVYLVSSIYRLLRQHLTFQKCMPCDKVPSSTMFSFVLVAATA